MLLSDKHRPTAKFSQSKPTSTQKLSETRAHFKLQLHATASATTQNASRRKKYAPRKPLMLVRIQKPPQQEQTSCK